MPIVRQAILKAADELISAVVKVVKDELLRCHVHNAAIARLSAG